MLIILISKTFLAPYSIRIVFFGLQMPEVCFAPGLERLRKTIHQEAEVKPQEPYQEIEQNEPFKSRAIKVRFAIVTFLSAMAIVMASILRLESVLPPLLIVLCMAFLSNLIWRVWGKRIRHITYFATFLDMFLITVGIHYIGGIESPLAWIYVIALIAIGSLRGVRVGIFAAVVSSLMYSSLLVAEFEGVIPHVDFKLLNPEYLHQDRFYLYIKLLSDNILFFITAGVSGTLSDRLVRYKNKLESGKKELEEKNEQLRREIAERKQAEEAIRASEANYRAIFDSANDAIFIHEIETGEILDFNQRACEMFGYTRDEMRMLDVSGLSTGEYPYTQQDANRLIEKAVTGSPQLAEWKAKHRSGRVFWVEVSVKSAVIGGKDCMLAILREINERKQAEKALRANEEKYRGLFENSIEGIFTVDLKGVLTSCNHAIEEILGFPKERLIGTNYRKYIVPEQCEIIFQEFNQLFRTGKPIRNIQYDIFRGDGERRAIEGNVTLIKKSDQIEEFQVTARDITDRKRAKEALKASEELYRMVVEEAKDIICTVNMNTGIITNANSFAVRILGHKYEEVVNKLSFIELVHPDDHERLFSRLRELAFEKNRKPNFPARLLKADGTFIHVEINGSVVYDSEGKPETFVGVIRDVTERNRAEQALKESEEKYRQVVENANEAIVVYQDGIVRYANPSTMEITGYSETELAAKPFVEFVYPADREMIIEHSLRRLGGEEIPYKYEFRVFDKGGNIRWMEVDAVLIDWEGKPAVLAFLNDITDRKQLERQLLQAQKMESIGTLAGGIAHDFNNLLGGILGYASFLKSKMNSDHAFFRYIDTIERSSMRAAELTSQLLAFARGGKYETKPIDLNVIIHETVGIIARTLDKSIEIETRPSSRIPTVEADAGQLQQVVMNLCLNAGDAMRNGGKLTIETNLEKLTESDARTRVEAKAGSYVSLSVTDTGIGMDRKTQEKIFEPFFTTKEGRKGTGLGLSMAYGVVKNHGGFIGVYSEPGLGTTFKVYLPVSGKPVAETPREQKVSHGSNELILVVDDEESIRSLARDMLEGHGYRVLSADDGEEAIRVYGEHNEDIDMVILDMVMPRMGGRETFIRLKEINPEVRALLSTGYSQDGKAQEILDSGVLGFLQKPYQLHVLLSKVRSVLDAKN